MADSPYIDILKVRQILGIKKRRINDMLIVLSSIGLFEKMRIDVFKWNGMDMLQMNRQFRYASSGGRISMANLTRLFFRHLVEYGTIDGINKLRKDYQFNGSKIHRRLYDIVNIFEGAGLLTRNWRESIESRVIHDEPPPSMDYVTIPLFPFEYEGSFTF